MDLDRPLTREEASLFFRILGRRYEKASLILTSNKSFLDWGEIFGDQVLATAILDRLLHHATTLNIIRRKLSTERKAQSGTARPSAETRGAGDPHRRIRDIFTCRKGDKIGCR
jgi:hypothetical protein